MATRRDGNDSSQDKGPEEETPFDGGIGFFGPPFEDFSRWGRVLAAFEVPGEGELEADANEPVQLECIDADWFEASDEPLDLMLWRSASSAQKLSVLEFKGFPTWLERQGAPGSIVWHLVEFQPAFPTEADGYLYRNLFSDGAPVSVKWAKPIHTSGSNLRRLEPRGYPFHWQWFHDFNYRPTQGFYDEYVAWVDRTLKHRITQNKSCNGVAIYDVGQGSWHALLHSRTRQPLAYVDVGGGVLYNRRTFPKDFERPPDVPLVVLSHWDWDHWSSAARYRSLLRSTWLTPQVSGKPIQRRFAMDIVRNGDLFVLPPGWNGTMQLGCLHLEGCTGKTENDRGLAATVYSRTVNGRACLLPGDAAYRYIPSVSSPAAAAFDALCMSHHGGLLHSNHCPAPKLKAVAANSSGPGNTYKHPLLKTLTTHKGNGWPLPIQTGMAGSRPCHVYLPWGKRPQVYHGTWDVASGTSLTV